MQQHPITVRPGQILGLRPARRHEKPGLYPIFAIAGGSAPVGDPAAPPAAPAAPPPTAPPAPTPPAATPPPPFEWDGKVESLPEPVQKLITDARADAGKARVTAKETAAAEARQQLLKDLGLVKDNEPGDPVELAKQLTAKDSTIRDLTVRSALSDALHTAGAKPIARAAILGDRILDDLDHSAADFADKVKAKVEEYIGRNPELKGGQAPAPTSGIPSTGGPGPNADIDAAIAAAEKAGDHATAIRLKRQKAYAPRA